MGIKERREREEQARLSSILHAAESVFAANGYYQTRMEDIAEAAELAKGTLYYYFTSKDEIYLQLLERESNRVLQEVKTRVSEKASFSQILRETIHFYLEYFEQNHSFLKIFFPCMCGIVRFEDHQLLRKSTMNFEHHGKFIRQALEKRMVLEELPFDLEKLMMFIRTLQIGIGMKLLEGNKTEAEAAADFFLGLMEKVMEDL